MTLENSGNRTSRPALIVGYGRFGQALATMLFEAGIQVYAFDPAVAVPGQLQPPGDRLAGVGHVFLCVPVWAFHQALTDLRSELGPEHVVVDVGSVRSGPERSMWDILGSAVPWVGTHPLFGPSAVALGERPLRVVVTPNELHPSAVEGVAALYERLGCEVKREAADDHDRRMAYSHALAFFVAKALMDLEAPTDSEFVPPSFQSIARTVESVRSDAGHLFLSIQNLNPHAERARGDLLDRMTQLHTELGLVDPDKLDEPTRPAFSIPDLGSAAPELRETRDLIDEVDRELVRVIARRAQLALRAGKIKRDSGSRIRDPEREREVLQERRAWALREDLDPAAVALVFEALMALARGAQEAGDTGAEKGGSEHQS